MLLLYIPLVHTLHTYTYTLHPSYRCTCMYAQRHASTTQTHSTTIPWYPHIPCWSNHPTPRDTRYHDITTSWHATDMHRQYDTTPQRYAYHVYPSTPQCTSAEMSPYQHTVFHSILLTGYPHIPYVSCHPTPGHPQIPHIQCTSTLKTLTHYSTDVCIAYMSLHTTPTPL